MVERQSGLTLLTHAVLLAGIAVVAFPIYVTFVASTHTLDDVVRAPMPLLPGHLLLTVPDGWPEAARLDGAGPLRFFASILVPVSRTSIAALFVILFIYGWNQYLWPLLVTTDEAMYTIVVAIHRMVAVAEAQVEWQGVMATAMLAMVPPIVVVIVMQRWFVKGLVETEK